MSTAFKVAVNYITFIALWFSIGVLIEHVIQPNHPSLYMSAGFLLAYVSHWLGLFRLRWL
jgi:hypothetical protein